MECPFCLEDFNEEALVCKDCGRDLRLVRPMINENLALVARIEELQIQIDSSRAAIERSTAPIRYWSVRIAIYFVAPAALVMAAHFLIVAFFDISVLYLRLASIAIPLPFGFALVWFSHTHIRWSFLNGICVGLFSVVGMLAAVSLVDNVPLLPQDFRDWRETLEYVTSIALATVTGSSIAIFVRRMFRHTSQSTGGPSPIAMAVARMIGRPVGAHALRRRAQKIQDNFRTIATGAATFAAGAGSLYTGVRSVFGS